jgi:ABC-type polysaccharide/polyol phosphate export permease
LVNVFLRDTRFVASFIHQLLFFLTPILYPASLLPSPLDVISQYSPYYLLIAPIRSSLYIDSTGIQTSFYANVAMACALLIFLKIILHELTRRLHATLYFKL